MLTKTNYQFSKCALKQQHISIPWDNYLMAHNEILTREQQTNIPWHVPSVVNAAYKYETDCKHQLVNQFDFPI